MNCNFKKRTTAALLLCSSYYLSSVAYAGMPQDQIKMAGTVLQKSGVVSNELIVKYKKPQGVSVLSLPGIASSKAIGKNNALRVLTVKANEDIGKVMDRIKDDPNVEYVEPNYTVSILDTTPDDPRLAELWGMNDSTGAGLNMLPAWDINTGNGDAVMAVIDTGVDYTHPDLAANMWVNPGEIADDGIDNDGNGYVDDIYGIDTVNNDSDPMDDHNHGTHCAGTIAGVGNNAEGVVGVNWNAKIVACKFLSAGGSGSISDATECLEYLHDLKINRGINIMGSNNSWGGGGFSQAFSDALDQHQAADMIFLAAAGNSNADNDQGGHYPSSYPQANVVAVAAIDVNGNKASFSSYGATSVDLSAPGVNVLSTVAGGGYSSFSGTSMATPHTAGLAALIKAQYPSYNTAQIKNLLMSSGVDNPNVPTVSGKNIRAYDVDGGALNCTNSSLQNRLSPAGDVVSANAGDVLVMSASRITCAEAGDPITVTVEETGESFQLLDDGVAPDQVAGDGIFAANWAVPGLGSYTVNYDDFDTFTVSVTLGYTEIEQAYEWVDTSAGTCSLQGDDNSLEVPLGFDFPFYDVPYSSVHVGTNGILSFAADNARAYSNTNLPNASTPNALLAPFWDDLYGVTGGICTITTGEPGDRVFTASWNVPHYGQNQSELVAFQVNLFESNGLIKFQYQDVIVGNSFDSGISATVGVENQNGTRATVHSYNEAVLENETAIGFIMAGDLMAVAGPDVDAFLSDVVEFDGSSSFSPDSPIVSYVWDSVAFDAPLTGVTASYQFNEIGEFPVTLTITTEDDQSVSDELIVRVTNPQAPVADAGRDQQWYIGGTVTLDGSLSSDEDGSIVSYEWTSPAFDAPLTGVNPSVTFDTAASHQVVLTVTDGQGLTSSDIVMVTVVPPVAPVAEAGDDVDTVTGMQIALSGSASSDADGEITYYEWYIENLGYFVGENLTIMLNNPGSYVATLTVYDDHGLTGTDQMTIVVNEPVPPVANPGATISTAIGLPVQFDASASTDADGTIVSYEWDVSAYADLTGVAPTFVFDYIGAYEVVLTVTDNHGLTDSATVIVSVAESAELRADAGADFRVFTGEVATFDGSGSNDPDGDIVAYTWVHADFGDTLSGVAPSFTFTTPGEKVVELIVRDNDGNEASDTVVVTVVEPIAPTPVVTPNPIVVRQGETIVISGAGSSDDGQIEDYLWESPLFGSLSGVEIVYTFDIPGDSTITLTVTDNDGLTSSLTVPVSVQALLPPVAEAGDDISAVAGDTITLNGGYSSDPDGAIVTYRWSSPAFDQDYFGLTVDVVVSNVGTFPVTLTVTDNDGLEASDALELVVAAGCGWRYDQMYLRGTFNGWTAPGLLMTQDEATCNWVASAEFTGSNFGSDTGPRFKFDVYGDWAVNFGTNRSDNTMVSRGRDILITEAGEYVISIDNDAWTFSVENGTPVAVAGPDVAIPVGGTATFDGSASSDNGSIVSYVWSSPAFGSDLVGEVVDFTFDAAGTYEVQLTVTDDEGNTAVDSLTVTVGAPCDTTYDQMTIRGGFNSWGTTSMSLNASCEWEAEVTFDAGDVMAFKFDVYGNWSVNYGDANGDGYAERTSGANIPVPGAGTYTVTFDDVSKRYTVN